MTLSYWGNQLITCRFYFFVTNCLVTELMKSLIAVSQMVSTSLPLCTFDSAMYSSLTGQLSESIYKICKHATWHINHCDHLYQRSTPRIFTNRLPATLIVCVFGLVFCNWMPVCLLLSLQALQLKQTNKFSDTTNQQTKSTVAALLWMFGT